MTAGSCGIPVLVCPTTAEPVIHNPGPLNPDAPDGRELVADGPPGFALHIWRNGMLTSHVDFVQEQPVLAHFNKLMQLTILARFAERP